MKHKSARLAWYLTHPQYYSEFFRIFIIYSKELLGISKNTPEQHQQSAQWCKSHAVSTAEALQQITGKRCTSLEKLFPAVLKAARDAEKNSKTRMGGPGNMGLLYYLCQQLQAKHVIETGVAYGWSSLSILLSLQKTSQEIKKQEMIKQNLGFQNKALLISTDKPYPGMNNQQDVGCVVPLELRQNWKLVRGSDRDMLPKILKRIPPLDLCHYDSDKTYEGRAWAYPLLWHKLRKGGWFVSDDIGDNLAFHDFCQKVGKKPIIVKTDKNYVGLLLKYSI